MPFGSLFGGGGSKTTVENNNQPWAQALPLMNHYLMQTPFKAGAGFNLVEQQPQQQMGGYSPQQQMGGYGGLPINSRFAGRAAMIGYNPYDNPLILSLIHI